MEQNDILEHFDFLINQIDSVSEKIEKELDYKIKECKENSKKINYLIQKQGDLLVYALNKFEPIYKKIHINNYLFSDIQKKITLSLGPIIFYDDSYPKTIVFYHIERNLLFEVKEESGELDLGKAKVFNWNKYLEKYSFEKAIEGLVYSAEIIDEIKRIEENKITIMENGLNNINFK